MFHIEVLVGTRNLGEQHRGEKNWSETANWGQDNILGRWRIIIWAEGRKCFWKLCNLAWQNTQFRDKLFLMVDVPQCPSLCVLTQYCILYLQTFQFFRNCLFTIVLFVSFLDHLGMSKSYFLHVNTSLASSHLLIIASAGGNQMTK